MNRQLICETAVDYRYVAPAALVGVVASAEGSFGTVVLSVALPAASAPISVIAPPFAGAAADDTTGMLLPKQTHRDHAGVMARKASRWSSRPRGQSMKS